MNRKTKILLLKFISFVSVIRGYNILVLILAQYLASIFIFSNASAKHVVLDINLFLIVLCSGLSVASGYIINNFYDAKKDLINKPNRTFFNRLISQNTKLKIYFALNFLVVVLASFISFRAVLFFSFFIFSLWFYSHKVKKQAILGSVMSSILAITPFFGVLLYYKNFYGVVFAHASYLFLLLWIKDMTKDLANISGDFAQNYRTIPVIYGEEFAKYVIYFIIVLTIIPFYILIQIEDIGYMDAYFYLSTMALIFYGYRLQKAKSKLNYLGLEYGLKFVIVVGVFSVILIRPSVLRFVLS